MRSYSGRSADIPQKDFLSRGGRTAREYRPFAGRKSLKVRAAPYRNHELGRAWSWRQTKLI